MAGLRLPCRHCPQHRARCTVHIRAQTTEHSGRAAAVKVRTSTLPIRILHLNVAFQICCGRDEPVLDSAAGPLALHEQESLLAADGSQSGLSLYRAYGALHPANQLMSLTLRPLTQIIVSFYRLIAMRHTMPGIHFTGPGAESSTADKALFYVFHGVPEVVFSAILVVPNTRKAFRTGIWGDYRSKDGDNGFSWFRRKPAKSQAQTGGATTYLILQEQSAADGAKLSV